MILADIIEELPHKVEIESVICFLEGGQERVVNLLLQLSPEQKEQLLQLDIPKVANLLLLLAYDNRKDCVALTQYIWEHYTNKDALFDAVIDFSRIIGYLELTSRLPHITVKALKRSNTRICTLLENYFCNLKRTHNEATTPFIVHAFKHTCDLNEFYYLLKFCFRQASIYDKPFKHFHDIMHAGNLEAYERIMLLQWAEKLSLSYLTHKKKLERVIAALKN